MLTTVGGERQIVGISQHSLSQRAWQHKLQDGVCFWAKAVSPVEQSVDDGKSVPLAPIGLELMTLTTAEVRRWGFRVLSPML